MITRTTALALTILAACKGGDSAKQTGAEPAATVDRRVQSEAPPPEEEAPTDDGDESGGAGTAMALEEGKMGKKDAKADAWASPASPAPKPKPAKGKAKVADNEAAEPVTRAWFPETFLFEPLVVTDATGSAVVPVKVPDRLTTWRVLALAHSRTGAQGGTVTSFLGTLPTYIDPVIPPFLIAGDVVRLPIQLVNTTEAAITSTLSVQAEGATVTGAAGARQIPAQGSVVDYATVRAARAGTVQLKAALGTTDAVVRTFDVLPNGKPERITRTGTLAAPRTFTIEGPAGSDPATDRVRLLVYPGALALLRAELAASSVRGGVAEDAYALLLAGRATALLAALGDKADPDALRTLTIVAGQRAVRAARTLDVPRATLLAEAALAHPQNAVLSRLGERAAAYLAKAQRPDGTFGGAPSTPPNASVTRGSGGTGWTLQRVLVATADATRAVAAANTTQAAKQRALGVNARAATAFQRNLEHVQDGYTAAAIVASGVGGALADTLRAKVREAIKDAPDGTKYLDVPQGVVRADGSIPGRAEATALAVLALAGAPKTAPSPDAGPIADLGSTLLGTYDPLFGWGDGRANLACMQAVVELFKSPIPSNVTITLTMDGKPITTGTLEGAKLRDVLVLDAPAPGLAGAHSWQLTAEPAVPGLGFSLTAHAWTPWPKQPVTGGLELAVPTTPTATVGKPIEVALTAIAPSGIALHVQHALPAGVQVDTPSLQALVTAGTIQRYQAADGKVELYVAPLQPGQTFTARYRVIPTLGGTLHTAASLIEAGGTRYYAPPATWTIR